MTNDQLIKKLQDMAWPDSQVNIEVSPKQSAGIGAPVPRRVWSFSVKQFIEMLTIEQPQTPSEWEDSTETMVEAVEYGANVKSEYVAYMLPPEATPASPPVESMADLKGHSQNYGEPGSIAHMLANGSAEQTE